MIFRRSGAAKPKPAAYQTLLYHKQAAFVKERRGGTAGILCDAIWGSRIAVIYAVSTRYFRHCML